MILNPSRQGVLEGEREFAASLIASDRDRAVLLHDRRVPSTQGNIDHVAIAASGVWIIDAKNYRGVIQRRDVGGWGGTSVAGRALTIDLSWEVVIARRSLQDSVGRSRRLRVALSSERTQIHPAVCFTDDERGMDHEAVRAQSWQDQCRDIP